MGLAIEVDTAGLRGCAAALDATSDRVRAGVHAGPPLAIAVPGWAVAAAAEALLTAVDQQLTATAEAVRSTGLLLTAAAAAYDSADERAAGRLRGAR